MSGRKLIQVPEDLKTNIEVLKDSFHAKTDYEVIEKLVRRHNSFTEFQHETTEKWNKETKRQQEETLQIGKAAKNDFNKLKKELGVGEDAGLLAFLLLHYEQSTSFDKLTMKYLRGLK